MDPGPCTGLNRRELLRAGAVAGAVVLGVRRLDAAQGARSSRGEVVVVGAGLAGLSAAYELERRGWRTRVLEARPRLGGRVWTTRGWAAGQHAEAGGEFIDSHHHALLGYARRFGLSLEDVRSSSRGLEDVVFLRGRRLARPRFAAGRGTRAAIDRFWARIYRYVERSGLVTPEAVGGRRLDRRSVADLLDELGIDGRARFLIGAEVRDDYGVEPAALSLLAMVLAERADYEQPNRGVEAFRLRGGSSRMVEALARRLRRGVETATPVSAIERGIDGVRVSAADGRAFEADHCVLAVPLPAIRSIKVTPPFNDALADAVATLEYAPVTKVLVQYHRRLWRRRGFSGDAVGDLGVGTLWEATDGQGRGQAGPGIMVAYAAGARGRRVAALNDASAQRRAVGDTALVWRGAARLAGTARSARWPAEPYSQGAWLSFRPGEVSPYWSAIRGSSGRLHMAGEHTVDGMGYMDAAIRSGRRAAARVEAV